MANTLNIVHEADAQRQHVRVNLPASITINDKKYTALDWSNAGMSLSLDDKKNLKEFTGETIQDGILHFVLDSFVLNIPMTIQIRNIDKNAQIVGLKFIDMTSRQISIMRHMVNAYITGEIINVNDLIHIVGRNNMSNPRNIPSNNKDGFDFGGIIRKFIVGFLSFLLLAYIAIAVYDQAYIVEASTAIVIADGLPVNAPATGVIGYKELQNGTSVSKGEPLMTVLSNSGTVTSLDSPCDCIVTNQLVSKGSIVNKDTPVLMLTPQNTPLYIEAYVAYENALLLTKKQNAIIEMNGNTISLPAKIESIQLQNNTSNNAKIKLVTNTKIPNINIGMPVKVRIDTAGWAF